MKRLIIPTLITTSLFSADLGDFISGLFDDNDVSKSIGMCYESNINASLNFNGLCDALNFQINESLDICAYAPDIPGLKKKSSSQSLGFSTSALQNYCSKSIDEKMESVTSLGEIWSVENNEKEDSTYPSGDTREDFYRGNQPVLDLDKLNKKQNESIAAMYNSSKEPYHQQTAKYLINLAKLKKVKDVTEISTSDVKVAKDMIAFDDQVKELSATVTSDIKLSSANSISSTLSSKLSNYNTSSGQNSENQKANQHADKVKKAIEASAKNKKGLYKELLTEDDDLAIPTQQTLELYKENVRPKYAMIIRRQQARASYINALIDTETQIKQDIVDLTAKKAVIMKYQFDADAAMDEIDSFVD